MVGKTPKFTCSKHPEKKAIMCCIDKSCKEKLYCESCLLVHNFKSKHDDNLYNVKCLLNGDLIDEMSKLVPTEVKDLISQLTQIHADFTQKVNELTDSLNKSILSLVEHSINLNHVVDQEKLATALFEEVDSSRTEDNLVQYAEQFDKFAKIVKNIDVNSHKLKFTKLSNLYKGLTNDFINFVNTKISDISGKSFAPIHVQEPFVKTNFPTSQIEPVGVIKNFNPLNINQSSSSLTEDYVSTKLFNQAYVLESIYKASNSDKTPQAFHKACDGIAHTLVLVKSGEYTFGGYTDAIWSSDRIGVQKESKLSFLFSVNNRKKFFIKQDQFKNGIYCRQNCGPVFGKGGLDLFVCNGSFPVNGSSPCSYETDSISFGFTGSEKYQEFEIEDYEVFRVIFK